MTEFNSDTWNNSRSPGSCGAGDILQIEFEDDLSFNDNDLESEDDLITRVEDQLNKKASKAQKKESKKQNQRKLSKNSESENSLCLGKAKNLLGNNGATSTSFSGKPLFPILEECDKLKNTKPKFADLDKFRIELSCSGNRTITGPESTYSCEMYSPSSEMEPFVDNAGTDVSLTTTEMQQGEESPSSPDTSEAVEGGLGGKRGTDKRNRNSSGTSNKETGCKKEKDQEQVKRKSGQHETDKKREESLDQRQKYRGAPRTERKSRQESDCSSKSAASPSKKEKSSFKRESEFSKDGRSSSIKEKKSSRQHGSSLKKTTNSETEEKSPIKSKKSSTENVRSPSRPERSSSRPEKVSVRAEKTPLWKERDNSNTRRVVRGKLNRSLFRTKTPGEDSEKNEKQNSEAEEEKENSVEGKNKEIVEEETGKMTGRFGDRNRRTCEIYIGNYPERFTEPDLRRLFEDNAIKVNVIRLKHAGPKVYAFAETDSSHMIEKAKKVLEGKEIGGRKLVVRSSRDTKRDGSPSRNIKRERSRSADTKRDRSPYRDIKKERSQPSPYRDARCEGDETVEGGERVIGHPGSEDDGDGGDGDGDERALHYGDLCRFFVKQLRREGSEEIEAQRVGTVMVDCWRSHSYEFHELEEMYLINMEQNDDRDLLGKELGKTLGEGKLPQGLTPGRLVTLTLEFFASEPRMEEMLRRAGAAGNQPEETTFRLSEDIGNPEDLTMEERKMAKTKKRELELPPRPEIKNKPKRPKMSKFDSLKPVSNFLENMLIKNGVDAANVELIVFDITARFVTAGYGWDKILMYHSKGEEKFVRKLVPYLQKSTSEFPDHMTCQDVLSLTFEFIDDFKFKLFNMIYKEQEEEANDSPERPPSPPGPAYMPRNDNSPQHSRTSVHSPRRTTEKTTENSSMSKERNETKKKDWNRESQKNDQDPKYAEKKPRSHEEEKKPASRSMDENRKPPMRTSDDDRRPPPGRPPYDEDRKFHHKSYEEERRLYGKPFEDQDRGYQKQYAYNDDDRRPFPRHSEGERRHYYDEEKRFPPKHFNDERRPPIKREFTDKREYTDKREFADPKYKLPPKDPRLIMGPRGNIASDPAFKYAVSDREKYWKRGPGPNEEARRPPHPSYPRENSRDERHPDKYSKKEDKSQKKEEAKSRNGKLSSTEGLRSDDGKTTYYHYSDNKPEADCSPPRERKHSQSSLSSSMQNILLKKENESRRAKIQSVRSKNKRDGSSSSRSRDRKSSSSRERKPKASSSDSEREDSQKMNEMKAKKKKLVKSVSPRDKKNKVSQSPKTSKSKVDVKKEPLKNEDQNIDVKKEDNCSESSDDNTSDHESKNNHEEDTEIRHIRRISSDVEQSDSESKEKPVPKKEGKKAKTLLEKVNEIIKSCVVLKKGGQEKPKQETKELLKEEDKNEDEEKEEEEKDDVGNMEEQKDMDEIIKENEIKKEKEIEHEEEMEKEREFRREREMIELKDSKKEPKKERDARKEKEIKEEKGVKLNHIDNQDEDADGSLESGELNSDAENTDHDISIDIFDEENKKLEAKLKLEKKKKAARTVTIVKKRKLESLKLKLAKKKLLAEKMKIDSDRSSDDDNSETRMAIKKLKQFERQQRRRSPPSRSSSKSRSRSRSRSPPRYKRMSRSRSWSGERRREFGRSRSWSRPPKRWSRSRSRSRERHSRDPHDQGLRQDFSHRGFQTTNKWIPISPCTLLDDVEIEQQSSMMVDISIKGEFSFKENCGCMVRITKWTGRDAVRNIEIRSQIVTLSETNMAQIEIENPIANKNLFLQKGDKVACISILSAPTYPGLFAGLTSPVDTYRTATKKWFRVASVVLHRKGGLDRITIPPGRTMKVIATCIGPLSKYIGKEVLITKLDKFDDFPVKAQISQIFENENIGIDVINKSNRTIMIEKCGKAVAVLGVWSVVKIDPENMRY